MNTGIPGTGIGGLFYIISGIAMLVYELFIFLIGRSTKARVLFALRQAWIIFLVILGLVMIDGLLIYLFRKIVVITNNGISSNVGSITLGVLSVRPVVYAALILLAVIFSVKFLGWCLTIFRPIPTLQKENN